MESTEQGEEASQQGVHHRRRSSGRLSPSAQGEGPLAGESDPQDDGGGGDPSEGQGGNGQSKGKGRLSEGGNEGGGGPSKGGNDGTSNSPPEEGNGHSEEEGGLTVEESSPGVGTEARQLAEVFQKVEQASEWGKELCQKGEKSLQWLAEGNLKWEDACQWGEEVYQRIGESSSSAEERERRREERSQANQQQGHLSLPRLPLPHVPPAKLIASIGVILVAYWLISIAIYYGTILLIVGILALILYRRNH